jgi:hypothetical protein
MNMNPCPLCDEIPHELEWHCYMAHMKPIESLSGRISGSVRRCWCGAVIALDNYEKHLYANGGPFIHYHASLLGVEP